MIPYHPHPSDRALGKRRAHMLTMIGDYRHLGGYPIVAEDHQRAAVA